ARHRPAARIQRGDLFLHGDAQHHRLWRYRPRHRARPDLRDAGGDVRRRAAALRLRRDRLLRSRRRGKWRRRQEELGSSIIRNAREGFMEPVRWGVISTAKIAVGKVLPGMLKSRDMKILAIASREEARAKPWARCLAIPRAYGSYEALLADPEIEAIYNPLPNHLHVPLTLAAARAGKHVLCEKPIAITAGESEALRELPPDRLVAEAFMVRQ